MTRISLWLAVSAFVFSPVASASFCDAHYPFNGSLADATGNGYDGMMIAEGGAPAAPQFGEGRFGQALHISGTSAMRAFLDLHHEACPQFTITAWFKLPSVDEGSPQPIVSTGARGGIPAIVASDSALILYGSGNGLRQKNAVRDGNTWFFVAATFDYEARTYKLFWRNRFQEGKLSDSPYDAEDAFWIGTRNDDFRFKAADLYVDEVHVYGRVLDLGEIRDASRSALAHTAPTPGAAQTAPIQPSLEGPAATTETGTNLTAPAAGLPGPINQPVATATDYAAANNEPQTLEDMRASTAARDPLAESSDAIAERVNENRAPDLSDASRGTESTDSTAPPAATDDSQPISGDVTVSPRGEPVLTGVSGHFGQNRVGLEVSDDFLGWIGWEESRDRPCYLSIRPDGEGLRSPSIPYSRCGAGGITPSEMLELSSGRATETSFRLWTIRGLRVCNNRRANMRLKGIQIFTARIDEQGRRVDLNESDTEERPNCAVWDEPVHCPSGTLATGVVVHANEASGSAEQIVGLQLICRELSTAT